MENSLYGSNDVLDMESEFDKAFDHTQKERNIANRSWDLYTGFDYGQWQKDAVSDLKQQNRHIVQFNFIRGKIDSLAGSIGRNDMDIDFVPIDSEYSDLTRALKEVFYSDKELMDWNRDFLRVVVDGLVHQGVLQLMISDKYSALGNIGLERIEPGNIVIDPNWRSHNSADMKKLWKVAYMTPEQLKTRYGHTNDRIETLLKRDALLGMTYEDDTSSSSMQFKSLDSSYGSLYRVIEQHYIKDIQKYVDIVVSDDLKVEIPEGLEDKEVKQFLEEHGLKQSDIIRHRKIEQEYWIKTSCAQLSSSEFLEDRKARIQVGRLPFYPWSSDRSNGRNSGKVELLIDAQQTLNKRESLVDHMISSSAHGGMFIDPAIVAGDAGKMSEIIKNMDKPNMKATTAPGALASGRRYTQLIEKNQYQGEIYQDIDRMTDNLDRLSQQTAALSGVNENAHETGILFARKQLQGEIALTTLTASVSQLWNDIGEGYFFLAKDLYSGVYREFRSDFKNSEKNDMVTLNEVSYNEEGQTIKNDFSKLQRHKVVVSQSPTGITVRTTERAINAELLNSLPQEFQLSRAQIVKNIIETLDMSDEDKEKMKYATDLEYQMAESRMKSQIAQMDAQIEQVAAQTQQMQQQTQMGDMQMAQGRMQGIPQGEGQPQQPPKQQPQQ